MTELVSTRMPRTSTASLTCPCLHSFFTNSGVKRFLYPGPPRWSAFLGEKLATGAKLAGSARTSRRASCASTQEDLQQLLSHGASMESLCRKSGEPGLFWSLLSHHRILAEHVKASVRATPCKSHFFTFVYKPRCQVNFILGQGVGRVSRLQRGRSERHAGAYPEGPAAHARKKTL